MAAPVAELLDVVGRKPLQGLERLRAGHLELSHVRDVEDAGALAHRTMLFEDSLVLDRHLPSPEIDQLRAQLSVQGVERGSLQGESLSRRGHEERKLAQRGD
jgi:hypothetical protein